jgi:ABC-type Fe3+/spermidine/putrescine transport system ATPase subunit
VGLLGQNGAGKTTSFYMIVGLVKPNSGNIYLDDMNITDFPMYKRAQQGIGYLAQEASIFRKLSVEDNILSFTTQGTYLKVGFDYNSYENWLDMRNMIYLGMRYGASTFSQTLNSYTIYNTSTYFPEAPTVISGEKYNGLTSQWIEVVLGLKAEVLKNIYLGFSVRANRLLTNTKPDNFDNLYIPGFNRTYNGDFGVGFNYTVSYFLPLYKTKAKDKPKKKK